MRAGPSEDAAGRFYFRAVDESLFVFDGARETAHLLNAGAGRLFLCLTDDFTAPERLRQAAGLGADTDWHACLDPWRAWGWIETDPGGRVRLSSARPCPPAPSRERPIKRSSGPVLLDRRRFRLCDRVFEARLLSDAGEGQGFAMRLAHARRMFGFLEGFPDAPPAGNFVDVSVDLTVTPGDFALACGERRLSTPSEAVAAGKMRLWLLDQAYGAPAPAILIHAAALGRPEGAVVLAGVSGAGKSTLSAALAASGWAFGTDDSLALGFSRQEAVVLPCPGAISLKAGSLLPLAGVHPALAALPEVGEGAKRGRYLAVPPARHMKAGTPESRVRCLVFPKYAPEAATTVRPLSASDALLGLMEAEFDLAEAAGMADLDAFLDLLDSVPRHAVTYGSLKDMDETLRHLLAQAC